LALRDRLIDGHGALVAEDVARNPRDRNASVPRRHGALQPPQPQRLDVRVVALRELLDRALLVGDGGGVCRIAGLRLALDRLLLGAELSHAASLWAGLTERHSTRVRCLISGLFV